MHLRGCRGMRAPRRRPARLRPCLVLFAEALESRQLLSTIPSTGPVNPDTLVAQPAVTPNQGPVIGPKVTNPTPTGYSAAQVRAAYGIAGDGAGQTIAIVDAYNAPNIKNDLKVFDPAVSSTTLKVVNQ